MKDTLRQWLILYQVKYLRIQKIKAILQKHSLSELFKLDRSSLLKLDLSEQQIKQLQQPNEDKITALMAWQKVSNNHILHWESEHYPALLLQISSPPLVLFCTGDINLLNTPQVAIVGSRNASHYSLDNAFRFANELSNQEITITSGFAQGIDEQAHLGALFNQGKTIAVLGTGCDVIYPKRHSQLAKTVAQQGLFISEFPPGTPPRAQHFPRRNRIISGMSLGVLVIEASLKSGSLITAKFALEQNKEIFAIPNSIHDPRSKGGHMLLKQGAKLTESTADILEELINWTNQKRPFMVNREVNKKNSEKKSQHSFTNEAMLVNLGYEVTPIDVIAERAQLPIDVVLSQLLDLELQDLVTAVSGGYVRKRRDEYV